MPGVVFYNLQVAIHHDPAVFSVEVSGLARAALAAFQQIIQLSPTLPDELLRGEVLPIGGVKEKLLAV